MKNLLLAFSCMLSFSAFAQVGIKEDNTAPIASAQLEVASSSKAFYPPRMTNAQVKSIASPQKGAVVFDTDLNCLSIYNGNKWICTGGTGSDQNASGQGNAPGTYSLSKMNSNSSGFLSIAETATDPSGNMFMTGYYSDAAPATLYNLDGSPAISFTSAGNYDAFVAAFSPSGTMLWAARIAGNDYDNASYISADANGVTVGGDFSSTPITVYNGRANNAAPETSWGSMGSSPSGDGFIIRYNTAGAVQWVARQAGSGFVYDPSVCSDGSFVYAATSVSGNQLTVYNGRTSAGAGEVLWGSLTAVGQCGALVKFNAATGAIVWVAKTEGTSMVFDDAAMSLSSCYVAYHGSGQFQPYHARTSAAGAETAWGASTAISGSDAYLVQYNLSTGAVNWVARGGGSGNDGFSKINADQSGNVYIAGLASSIQLAAPLSLKNARTTVGAAENSWGDLKPDVNNGRIGFFAKYNSAGTVVWGGHIFGSSTGFAAVLSDVAADRNGSVYLSGYYNSGSLDVYNAKTAGGEQEAFYQTLPYDPTYRGFIMKVTFTGKVEWISKFSSQNYSSAQQPTTVSVFHPNTGTTLPVIYGAGNYKGTLQLGANVVSTLSTVLGDAYWFKYVAED